MAGSFFQLYVPAGTTTPFHFGPTISSDQANYIATFTYGDGRKGVYRDKTVPVGSFPPNAFGLHDMHGNVREWVEDCWGDSYAGAPVDGSAWSSGDCDYRVERGGSWSDLPGFVRSAKRSWNKSNYAAANRGFRIPKLYRKGSQHPQPTALARRAVNGRCGS